MRVCPDTDRHFHMSVCVCPGKEGKPCPVLSGLSGQCPGHVRAGVGQINEERDGA